MEYIKSFVKDKEEKEIAAITAAPAGSALARLERKRQAKQLRSAQLAAERGEPVAKITDAPSADSVVFDADGYRHVYCPVSDILDKDIMGMLSDIIYCIDTESFPNEGSAYDQSYMFRVAFTVISREREIIKNEYEKKAIEDAQKKNKQQTTAKRGRGAR